MGRHVGVSDLLGPTSLFSGSKAYFILVNHIRGSCGYNSLVLSINFTACSCSISIPTNLCDGPFYLINGDHRVYYSFLSKI